MLSKYIPLPTAAGLAPKGGWRDPAQHNRHPTHAQRRTAPIHGPEAGRNEAAVISGYGRQDWSVSAGWRGGDCLQSRRSTALHPFATPITIRSSGKRNFNLLPF